MTAGGEQQATCPEGPSEKDSDTSVPYSASEDAFLPRSQSSW